MKKKILNLIAACIFFMAGYAQEMEGEPIAVFYTDAEPGVDLFEIYISSTIADITYTFDFGDGNILPLELLSKNTFMGGSQYVGEEGMVKVYGDPEFVLAFKINSSKLTGMDIADIEGLSTLEVNNNPAFTEIDLSDKPNLTQLTFFNVGIEELDLSSNNNIQSITIQSSALRSITFADNLATLSRLNLRDNQLTEIDLMGLGKCENMSSLNLSGNPIERIEFPEGWNTFQELTIQYTGLTEINLTNLSNVSSLYLSGNQLTEIDLSPCRRMVKLDCASNKLTQLDLSANANISSLDCSNNQISNIILSPYFERFATLNIGNNELSFSTFPVPQDNWGTFLTFFPQARIELPETAEVFDLSSEYMVGETVTEFLWMTEFYVELEEGVDYVMEEPGVFRFLKEQEDLVYCEMTNAVFTEYNNYGFNYLETTFVNVEIGEDPGPGPDPGHGIAQESLATAIKIEGNIITVPADANTPVSLYDIAGRLLIEKTGENGEAVLVAPSAGVYIIRFTENNATASRKVFIK